MSAALREFLTGAGLLGRGFGLIARRPGLFFLGLLPAVISGLIYAAALIFLAYNITDVAAAVTWFADDWSTYWRNSIRALAGVAVFGVAGLLTVITFTAVTQLIGDPFYEKISELVENRFGGVPDAVESVWWRSMLRNLADSLRLIALGALLAIPLFLIGLIPVVGQIVGISVGGAVGGWLLAMELTGVPFQRRGQRLRHRRQALRKQRPLALGFGVAVFCCFLIPLGAIIVMPAAVAGAALLARKSLHQPTDMVTVASL